LLHYSGNPVWKQMASDTSATFSIREALAHEAPRVIALLTQNRQSPQDVLASGTRYWVAEDAQGAFIGTIGLEFGRDAVLLRSAGVLLPWRSQGIAAVLTQEAIDAATRAGCRAIYLFSTGAGGYWSRFGFCEVPVSEVVAALPDAPQVRQYTALGWLQTEVAWRRDVAG
jgi:N-acetylglutamate synthase-like GNAT family acetyltransferase